MDISSIINAIKAKVHDAIVRLHRQDEGVKVAKEGLGWTYQNEEKGKTEKKPKGWQTMKKSNFP